ncbi:hypothetical protein WA577_003086, partial [Blastocystis sp. JDR]
MSIRKPNTISLSPLSMEQTVDESEFATELCPSCHQLVQHGRFCSECGACLSLPPIASDVLLLREGGHAISSLNGDREWPDASLQKPYPYNPPDASASPSGPYQAVGTIRPGRRFSMDSLDRDPLGGSYQPVDSQMNSLPSSLLSSNSMFKPRARASTISGNSFSQLLPGDEAGLADPSYDLRSVDPTSYPLRTSSFAPDEKPANSFHHKRASLDQLYFASPLFDLDYGASPLDPFAPLD